MATLSADAPRTYYQGNMRERPVVASDIIYEGAAVGDNAAGYARPLVAGDHFWGFAEYKVDNSSGAAGDKVVRCRTSGRIKLSISGLAITDVGKDVYASDDDTFTLTAGSNTRIGHVHDWIETGVGVVEFAAVHGVQTALTDNSGGTANTTLEDVATGVTGVDGTGSNAASKADVDTRLTAIANNFADLAASVNTIIGRLGQ